MTPSYRKPVNKFRSVKKFRQHSNRTRGANIAAPMRGGIRF